MNDAETLVREFCDAWSKRDPDLLTDYFTEDGVYHNMPMQPLEGHDAIRGFLTGFLAAVTSAEFRMLNVTASDTVVMTERVDAFHLADGKQGAFPVMGIFEVRDGKIAAWRDYFDMAQVTAFLTGA
ncbi:MAG TPA: SgcJ/EcaC family oxidoreductase [Actinomycetota bacterium]|nr:SgcJ/EcaC family oxidoreductase [Actinomycetota bacterium]